jgi:hypothetical protein
VKQFPGRIAQVKEWHAVIKFQITVIGCYSQLAQVVFEFGKPHFLTPWILIVYGYFETRIGILGLSRKLNEIRAGGVPEVLV